MQLDENRSACRAPGIVAVKRRKRELTIGNLRRVFGKVAGAKNSAALLSDACRAGTGPCDTPKNSLIHLRPDRAGQRRQQHESCQPSEGGGVNLVERFIFVYSEVESNATIVPVPASAKRAFFANGTVACAIALNCA